MKRPHLVREIVETLILTLLIFLAIRFLIQSYHVDGNSMEPGLKTNQSVVVNKVAYMFHAPERGDVIVFHFPQDTTKDFIKRVIGLPGDTITIDYNSVRVNGVLLDEKAYISAPLNTGTVHEKVPANQFFVMGDNRPESYDSRSWGYVPRDYIIGKAVLVFWPLDKIHFIDTHPDVYKHIPNPGSGDNKKPSQPAVTPTPTQNKQGAIIHTREKEKV